MKKSIILGVCLAAAMFVIGCKEDDNNEEGAPVINKLTADKETVGVGGTVTLTCDAIDPEDDELSFSWQSSGGGSFANSQINPAVWTAPNQEGDYSIVCEVSDPGEKTDSDTILIHVIDNAAPQIDSIMGDTLGTAGHTLIFTCWAVDADGEALSYTWSAPDGGSFAGTTDTMSVSWQAAQASGTYRIVCTVSDGVLEDQDTAIVEIQNYFPIGLGNTKSYEGYLFAQKVTMNTNVVSRVDLGQGRIRWEVERIIYVGDALNQHDTALAYIVSGDSVFFDDPKTIAEYLGLLLPLWVGKTWDTKGNGTASVQEMVGHSVPCGTFADCMHLEITGGQVDRTLWLAPDVGVIVTEVKIDQEWVDLELVSYNSGS